MSLLVLEACSNRDKDDGEEKRIREVVSLLR